MAAPVYTAMRHTTKPQQPIIDAIAVGGDGAPLPATKPKRPKRQPTPTQLAGLRPPWQPGQSGNPAGRPPNTPLVTPAIRRMAQLSYEQFRRIDPSTLSMAELLAYQAFRDAIDNEAGYQQGTKSRDTLLDRIDGKLGDKSDAAIEIHGGQVVITSWPGAQAE